MAEIIRMPRLSDTMEEGTVAKWLKQVGDKISEGDILAEIETDKAVQEFESFYDAELLYIGVKDGETAPVDSILAIIGEKGEDFSDLLASEDSSSSGEESVSESKEEETKVVELSVDNTSVDNSNGRIKASPLAKKIASDKNINLSDVKGSGPNGRIIKSDIESYTPSSSVSAKSTSVVIAKGETSVVENSQMRKVIAKRLLESKNSAPHYYLSMEIDMSSAIEARKAVNAIPDIKISFNDLVMKATAAALRKHPQINTSWSDNATTYHSDINIGVAVAVEDGLLVPVIKNTDFKTLTEISAQVRELAGKAREKRLSPADMDGSTFTISNLGMFGVEYFTSIINQPNSAILSVGAILQKPVVKDGQVVPGNIMKVSLACDHRTIDGATGAAFLQTLKQMLETPLAILV